MSVASSMLGVSEQMTSFCNCPVSVVASGDTTLFYLHTMCPSYLVEKSTLRRMLLLACPTESPLDSLSMMSPSVTGPGMWRPKPPGLSQSFRLGLGLNKLPKLLSRSEEIYPDSLRKHLPRHL